MVPAMQNFYIFKKVLSENSFMFAIKGFYDGSSVVVEEPIPVKEQYEVIVTFISSIATENKERVYLEKLRELNGSIKDDSFIEWNDFPLENSLSRSIL
jgi:hypothetical protein